jgi:tetratricopeptide (TPR) repeat protein
MVSNNHYRVAENLEREVKVGPSWDQNSPDRANRTRQALDQGMQSGKLALRDVVRVMADRKDLTMGRYHGLAPAAVASMDQIKAVVFSPFTREIFVSDGQSPPSARGTFVRIRFDDFENLERFGERDPSEDFRAEDVVRGTANDLALYPSFEPYIQATLVLDGHGSYDVQRALPWIDQAIALEPAEPLLRLMRGYLSMRVRQYERGLEELDSARKSSLLDSHRRQVATFIRAKALDVLGRRAEALQEYGAIVSAGEAHAALRKAAEKHLQSPSSRQDLDHLSPDSKMFDFSSYD